MTAKLIDERKDIPGYEWYQANIFGDIKSLNYNREKRGKVLKPHINKITWYSQVTICWKLRTVHRLIAITFLPNYFNKKTVNHKDNNRTNNILSNLEWATYSENIKYWYDHWNIISPHWLLWKFGKEHPRSKFYIHNTIEEPSVTVAFLDVYLKSIYERINSLKFVDRNTTIEKFSDKSF